MFTYPFSALIAVEYPELGGAENHQRDQHDHKEDDPGDRAGVAHLEVGEALLVQLHAQHIGGLHRAAVGDDKGGGEVLQRLNGLHDEVEEDDRGDLRHRDAEEHLRLGGTVDLSGLIQVGGDIFQCRKEHDH